MLYDLLFDWQKKLVDKYKSKENFGLFLDMGLGKTPISLGLAEVNESDCIIIVSINSKVLEDENDNGSWLYWAKHLNKQYDVYRKTIDSSKFKPENNNLLIINYESLFKRNVRTKNSIELKDDLLKMVESSKHRNISVIVDESHKVKGLHSKQTKSILALQKKLWIYAENAHFYLLTGTPFTTGYIDLYTQLKILGNNYTKGQFEEEFCVKGNVPGLRGWEQPIVGYKNVHGLFNLVHRYAITIDSEEMVDLPEKIFIYHPYKCTSQFRLYTSEKLPANKIEEELARRNNTIFNCTSTAKRNNPFYRNIAYPSFQWLAETPSQFFLRARQLSVGFQGNAECAEWYDYTRLGMLKKFLSENESNYVLFYNYVPELIELYDICSELGYNVDVYSGEIKSLDYYEKYSNLSEAERLTSTKNIILANFASGSTGMNWQLYHNCIIFSLPVYSHYAQAIKRIHRIGQKNTCIYHIFIQENWLDEGMKEALANKIDYNNEMFDSDVKRVQYLTSE